MTTDNENDKIRHQLDTIDSDQQLECVDQDGTSDNAIASVQQQLSNITTIKHLPATPSSASSSPSTTPKMY